ncbi:BLUF domain-containing protein [Pannonibacter sp.]|uniref:BLUF domain-containing protein n=1 Tax=Pannonibacter sp. TaxID=1906786 RepID=UPI00395073F2
MMSDLYHICYISMMKRAEFKPNIGQGLDNLLETSRRNNAHNGITGCLLFTGEVFVHVLEGGEVEVQETFGRITRDPRHTDVRVLSEGPILERAFSDMFSTAGVSSPLSADAIEEIRAAFDNPAKHLHPREMTTLLAVLTQEDRHVDALLAS